MVYLLARIYLHLPKDAYLKRLQSFDDNNFKWHVTLCKCGIKSHELRHMIRIFRDDYKWLVHKEEDGSFRRFSLRESISLVVHLMRNFEREHWDIILALYDMDWDFEEIYKKHNKTKRCIYYFLGKYIKKPMIDFLSSLN
ncbi:MAG: hypothetical protein HY811_00120 [Planctomycetes bacterium]|nr:hypothetical protein [Planctomycetota bacterium]